MIKPYKGYEGAVTEVDPEADLISGQVLDIQDVVHFTGRTPAELQKAFEESVDVYLELCAERGEEPNKPYSGVFQVRVAPEQHKRAARAARLRGQSLNGWVREAMEQAARAQEAPDLQAM